MSDELLRKENKFYELNVELERKTKELMKEVNSVVNTRLSFDSESNSRLVNNNTNKITRNGDSNSKFHSSKFVPDSTIKDFQSDTNLSRYLTGSKQSADVKENPNEDDGYVELYERPCNGVRNDAVVRFLKSKAKILETELEAIKVEYKKKCDYSGELQAENKKIDEERLKFYGQLTTAKENLVKIETANNSHLINLQRTENENTALKKEIDALKKELKISNQNSSSYSIRLNRSLEENERLRKALKCSQLDEKELKEENRKLEEDKKAAITSMEKQRTELIHAFKKQMLLVDNLKRQKAHLEAGMMIKYTEEELFKLLDWKLDDA